MGELMGLVGDVIGVTAIVLHSAECADEVPAVGEDLEACGQSAGAIGAGAQQLFDGVPASDALIAGWFEVQTVFLPDRGSRAAGFLTPVEQIRRSEADADRFIPLSGFDMFGGFGQATAKMGDEMYKDLDGDNQITVKDQVNIGTTDPKLIYGVALNIQYKKWGISILGNGADDFVGGSSYLQISENQLNASTIGVPSKYAYERMWSPSNPNGTYPAAGASNTHESDRVNSGWYYFVLKSIALNYDFGRNPFKAVKGIKGLSASLNFQNFVTFSSQRGYNPENGDTSYPWIKSVSISVNAKF